MSASAKCWLLGVVICGLSIAETAAEGQRNDQPEVVTKYGSQQGKLTSVEGTDRSVNVFLGIPFAKPPIGSLRFSPPQPAEPWSHMRDATSYPPMCLQDLEWVAVMKKTMKAKCPKLTVSEDCLYLNVFTPEMKARLPGVGRHQLHFNFSWQPDVFRLIMKRLERSRDSRPTPSNSAVISCLRSLGGARAHLMDYHPGEIYFSTGTNDARGNWGLLDQVAALQWVQENIALFGGDPSSVTIFGESAGGVSVGAQILSPLSKGLFHRAISESGVAQLPGLFISHPEVIAQKVANVSGCEASSSAVVHCLRSKAEEELRVLNANLILEIGIVPAVVDGEFIPKAPEELLASKELNPVPYLTGVNNNEYGWLIPEVQNFSGITEGMDKETITAAFQQTASLLRLPPESVKMILDEYLGDTKDRAKLRDRFLDMMGDIIFVLPALQVARYHRDFGAAVFFYEFQHRPTAFKDTKPDFVKADHGDELGFVFGAPFLRSDSVIISDSTEDEKQLSRTIMKYWGNFARNGNPNGKGLVEWPRFDLNEEYLELNLEQRKSKKLKKNRVDFWLKTLPEKMKKMAKEKETHGEL